MYFFTFISTFLYPYDNSRCVFYFRHVSNKTCIFHEGKEEALKPDDDIELFKPMIEDLGHITTSKP